MCSPRSALSAAEHAVEAVGTAGGRPERVADGAGAEGKESPAIVAEVMVAAVKAATLVAALENAPGAAEPAAVVGSAVAGTAVAETVEVEAAAKVMVG